MCSSRAEQLIVFVWVKTHYCIISSAIMNFWRAAGLKWVFLSFILCVVIYELRSYSVIVLRLSVRRKKLYPGALTDASRCLEPIFFKIKVWKLWRMKISIKKNRMILRQYATFVYLYRVKDENYAVILWKFALFSCCHF